MLSNIIPKNLNFLQVVKNYKKYYEKNLYNTNDLTTISKITNKEIEVNYLIKEEILEKEYDYID